MNQSQIDLRFIADSLEPQKRRPGRPKGGDYSLPEEPHLTPTYGCRAWVNHATGEDACQHVHPHGPLPKGSHVYAECCSKTGIEGHPIFSRDAVDRNGDRKWVQGGSRKVYKPGQYAGGTGAVESQKTNRETREEQDQLYLALLNAGWPTKTIAKKFDVKTLEVKSGIARAVGTGCRGGEPRDRNRDLRCVRRGNGLDRKSAQDGRSPLGSLRWLLRRANHGRT